MRIIAGRFRGRRLAVLGKGDMAAHLRPTPDRVRESLFSMLTHLRAIDEARVLDLFAGTGALGLEALSRGAGDVRLVENGRVAAGLIQRNIESLGCDDAAQLIRRDATRLGVCSDGPANLVFVDPPYGKGLGQIALVNAAGGGWIAQGGLVIWEENAEQNAPDGFSIQESRRFGSTYVTVLRYGDTV